MDLRAADLVRAVRAGEDAFTVHYACESFYEALDHPPAISAISISTVPRNSSLTFSRIDSADAAGAEAKLLTDFYTWLRSKPDARLVHWNMNSSDFGFVGLRRRHDYLGLTGAHDHPEERTFDLGTLIADRHGPDYASHPRLTKMLGLNGVATRYSLSGAEQAQRFRDAAHADLARCAEERARSIAALAELFVSGGLQTERSGPAVNFADRSLDSVEVILAIGVRLEDVGRELARRHAGRSTLMLADEYDYQDLLRTMLRLFFDDVRPEDHAPVEAGASSRIDFVLPEFAIAVEVKVARDGMTAGSLGEELVVDARRYGAHGGVRHLICLVFDLEGRLPNPGGLERDLSGPHDGIAVTAKIFR